MKLIFLDLKTLGFPVDVSGLNQFGEVELYDCAADDSVAALIEDADILITNQNRLDERNLKTAKKLKLICQTGTGYNNIDIDHCKKRGIAVANVPAYAANSVAQHTFAMLFYLISHSGFYDQYTKQSKDAFCGNGYEDQDFFELEGKAWGIIGLGEIGKKVAQYAGGFGCRVIYYSTSGANANNSFERVSLEEILKDSDILSIHAPLNEKTRYLIGLNELKQMKPTAYLLNLGRGGIIRESELALALSQNLIAGAGLDVLEQEPVSPDNPLLAIDNPEKLYLTPHIGYGSKEARERLMRTVCENIEYFLRQEKHNRIV